MSEIKPQNIAFKYGLIGGFILIITSLVFFILDQPDSKISQYISYAVIIMVVILGIQEYKRKALGGFLKLSQGLGVGTLIGVVLGIVSGIWILVYVNAIDTGFSERMMENSITQMEEQGLSDEQIEQSMSFTSFFISPVALSIMSVIMNIIFAFFIALIASLIMRKEPTVN